MRSFSSSILRFGPWFTPYRINIDKETVTCSKNDGSRTAYLTKTMVSLKKSTITDIQIFDNLFWCDLKIITASGQPVYLRHFTGSDAMTIKALIHP